ncbi:hypothetical protein [Phenylobacterium sp.]|jgi:hypothetical protein|uniref:hypothetical protein n=1 Tax=Phenylobacterium sp. TaxID=1871053 RepID=UPI00272F48EC|nr:hypothetical protein [Phenylobacterium sp.]MDP1600713.1 hypothetical protein [Phenylobacterium sp.]MDP3590785.1 hypothetical protein [Phenylobacterium sp.]
MPSPPGLPEFDLPMIFGDKMAGLGYQAGVCRLAFSANTADEAGQEEMVKTGYLILTPGCMLELRSQIDQILTELERQGVISFTPDKLDG